MVRLRCTKYWSWGLPSRRRQPPHHHGEGGGRPKTEKFHLVALQRGLAADSRGSGQALAAAAVPHDPQVGTEGVLF